MISFSFGGLPFLVCMCYFPAKRIQNKAVVNETRSVEELGALLAKAEATFEMQQVTNHFNLGRWSW